jgi:UDP-N-acetylglucosamine 2-epimerase (non-hydrolysing)
VSHTAIQDLILVAGARPNFMKIAPILRALQAAEHSLRVRLVHTGQHYDRGMSEIFFEQLGIDPPDVNLEVGPGRQGEQTARILERFEDYLLREHSRPSGIVVVGDVNSTAACGLACVKLGHRLAHVEAGLRSFDRSMPEEINRIVTDHLADVLLVSEPAGLENLRAEGLDHEGVRYVGNVMIDTLVHELEAARAGELPPGTASHENGFAYVTLHRPSNVDDRARLAALVGLLLWVGERLPVIFPAHPRTRQKLAAFGLASGLEGPGSVRVLDPVPYRQALALMERARLVLTDSGGIQEETTFLGTPCLTLRSNTERPVTLSHGTNTLVGNDLNRARQEVEAVLGAPARAPLPIEGWDGHAAERVVQALVELWT